MDNANTPEYLAKIRNSVIENLSRTKFGPSVQMTNVPGDIVGMDDEADAEMDDQDQDENPDSRYTQRRWDQRIEKDGELSESEDEEENSRNGIVKQPGVRKRMNIMDYQNPRAAPDIESGAATPASASANGEAAVAAANGDLHEDLMKAKASASPPLGASALAANNHSANASQASRVSQAGDVDMTEAQAAPPAAPAMQHPQAVLGPQMTPPPSPPRAAAVGPATNGTHTVEASAPSADDVEMADAPATSNGGPSAAKADGEAERNEEDMNAEAATRAAEATL
jgi:histone deacetylase 1/2